MAGLFSVVSGPINSRSIKEVGFEKLEAADVQILFPEASNGVIVNDTDPGSGNTPSRYLEIWVSFPSVSKIMG